MATNKDSIMTYIRFRTHTDKDAKDAVTYDGNMQTVRVFGEQMKAKGQRSLEYTYNRVLHPGSQLEVYKLSGVPLVDRLFEGYNATLFAYGQTGSGKTYTMMGPDGGQMGSDQEGIIPRMMKDVFARIEALSAQNPNTSYNVQVSMFDIYLEKVRDLMTPDVLKKQHPSQNCRVSWANKRGVYLTHRDRTPISQQQASHPDDVIRYIEQGMKMRNKAGGVASTNMNKFSSRSHLVVMVKLEMKADGGIRASKLMLCDLAGSEKVRNTGSVGLALKQARNINRGLSVLGHVLEQLSRGKPASFNDSPLTRCLRDSLGGNCKTALIAGCRPDEKFYQETLSTLRFAKNAKNVKCKPVVNETLSIAQYKALLKRKERRLSMITASMHNYQHGYTAASDYAQVLEKVAEEHGVDVQQLAKTNGLESIAEIQKRIETAQQQTKARMAGNDDEKVSNDGGFGMALEAGFGAPGETSSSSGNVSRLSEGALRMTRGVAMMQQAALLERIEHLEEDLQDNRTQLLAVRDEFDNVQQENDDLTMEMDRARQTKLQLHATQGDLFSARQNMKILEQKVLYLERLNKEGRQENAMLESAKQPRKRSFAQQLLKSELSRQRLATALKQGDPEVTTKFVHELTEQTREVERLNNLLQKKQKQIDAFQKLRAAENDSRKQADDSLLFAFSKYKLDTDQLKKQVAQTDASKERMQQQIEELKASRDQFRARSSGKIRVKDCGDNFFRYVSADEFQKKLGRRCLRPIRKQRKPRQPRSKSAEPSPRKQATAGSEQVKFAKDMQQEVEVRATPVQKMQALRARIKSGLKDASARAGIEEEFKTWLNKSRADVEGALSRINVSFQPCIKLISSPTA